MMRKTAFLACALAMVSSGCSTQTFPSIATLPLPTLTAASATQSPSATSRLSGPTCFVASDLSPVAFTPDSLSIVIRSQDGVQVIRLQDGQEVVHLSAPDMIVTAAVSPSGNMVAWSLPDGSIQLVDLSTQRVTSTLADHADPVFHMKFSPDGTKLVSASHDGSVRIWGVAQATLAKMILAGGEVVGIGVAADGSQLATVPSDGPVRIWDLQSGELLSEPGGTGGYDTSDAVFSADDQYLIADLATGIQLWNLTTGQEIWNEPTNSMAVAYSPDGRYLAYSDIEKGNSVFLTSPDGQAVVAELRGMQGPVWQLFFSPDGSMLAVSDGISIGIWRVEDGKLLNVGKSACP